MAKNHDIKDLKLAEAGQLKIEWAEQQMTVLRLLKERFTKEKPLKGNTIGCCLHVTSETANLMITLKSGGAKVVLCASNPLSTQDQVAAALVIKHGISVYAWRGENSNTYYRHINQVLDSHPTITMDDGADLITILHTKRTKQLPEIIGSSEETTTGVIRLKAMEREGDLKLPVMAVNDSDTKHLFDNRYGTGQSTLDGIMRATNILIAGKMVVIAGYGWCSRGIASRAKGMGAKVIVTEVDPVKALEAHMDGFMVLPMIKAAKIGDIFITATGDKHILTTKHFAKMKNGAILANSGHFNVEINLDDLKKLSSGHHVIRPNLEEYQLKGKKIYLLAEGRLVNLAAAEGHPAEVMDLSFSDQALSAEYFVQHKGQLKNCVYTLPKKLDLEVARLKLKSLGVAIDKLTAEQKAYLGSWKEGT
jgi:adenosylhomocysteinase